jgi:hypothetical protein
MITHPLRFLTQTNGIGRCRDYTDNNIIYFGNYVLFRPSYQRDKHGEGYNYSKAILVNLEKSHIDITKFYQLLNNHSIDITKERHILYEHYTAYNNLYDDKWLKLLSQANTYQVLEIPNTNAYYLNRIQFDAKQNTLLITHVTYTNSRTYTLIDLTTLSIIDSEFGNNKAKKYITYADIVFDCKFEYTYYSPYDLDNAYRDISREYMNVNFETIISNAKILKNELLPSKYTAIPTGSFKSPGLLFIEIGAWDISWHLKNYCGGYPMQYLMDSSNISADMQYKVYEYLLRDIYTYLTQLYKLMQLLFVTATYYLETKPYCDQPIFTEFKIPDTYSAFLKTCC